MRKYLLSLPVHKQAVLAMIFANIIWGAASPVFKLALQNITPFTLAFFRFYFAMFLLLPFACRNLNIKRNDIPSLILLSIFGITVNITFFFFGLEMAPSINAPIIASSGPVFGYILSLKMLSEKPSRKVFTGMMVSLFGVMVIIAQPFFRQGGFSGEIAGNLFFLLATFGSVGHSIFSKKIASKYPAETLTFWSFLIGSLTFFPFFIREMVIYHPLNDLDYRGITGLVFGIFLSSALAYLAFQWGIKKITAQETGIFTYIDPIAATIIAIPLLGEKITPIFITGSLLVFLGIFIAEGRIHYHPFHKLAGK